MYGYSSGIYDKVISMSQVNQTYAPVCMRMYILEMSNCGNNNINFDESFFKVSE